MRSRKTLEKKIQTTVITLIRITISTDLQLVSARMCLYQLRKNQRLVITFTHYPFIACCWRLCCCCYYLFCCCCCESGGIKITKNKFISRFEKWLNLVRDKISLYLFQGHHHQKSKDPLTLLVRLYAHDMKAIRDLEKVRVNPDFTSRIRNDLEFYIP